MLLKSHDQLFSTSLCSCCYRPDYQPRSIIVEKTPHTYFLCTHQSVIRSRLEILSYHFPIWYFNFWPYGQLRAVRGKNPIMNYEQLLSSVLACTVVSLSLFKLADRWHFFINFTMVEFGLVRSVGASQLREGGRQYHGCHGWHGAALCWRCMHIY